MAETYYDLLEVDRDASTEAIEAAYRERLTDVHPDVSDDPDAGERTRRLIEAKEVLTDEAERSRYDRLGHERYCRFHGSFVEADESDVADASDAGRDAAAASEARRNYANTSTTSDADASTDNDASSWSTADAESGRWGSGGGETDSTRQGVNDGPGGTAQDTGRRSVQGNRAWRTVDAGDGYAIGEDRTPLRTRLFPSGPSVVVLFTAFALYPLLLWAAVYPPFPLVANVVVGISLVLVVAFFQSMPRVGMFVFGVWSVVLPLIVWQGFGSAPTSVTTAVTVVGTALPFGLSVLTWRILRV